MDPKAGLVMPIWLRAIKAISYSLWIGAMAVVLPGSVYVLFFVDESRVSAGSLHAGSPLPDKLAFLGFLVIVFVVGLVVNRITWRLAERRLRPTSPAAAKF